MEESNRRIINKYIHPDGVKSCQLVMGMTDLEAGQRLEYHALPSHERRMEVYLYFDLPETAWCFTIWANRRKHGISVVRNEEAVISPSWSIHAGCGTQNYTFIWGMAGENQAFNDMDPVPMSELR